jgi:hypothetical protein
MYQGKPLAGLLFQGGHLAAPFNISRGTWGSRMTVLAVGGGLAGARHAPFSYAASDEAGGR